MLVWDENKRRANIEKHGVDFVIAENFDWDTAIFIKTDWIAHEQRETVVGLIDEELYAMVYVDLDEDTRIISLRRADNREKRLWMEI